MTNEQTRQGFRIVFAQVNMDRESPDHYVESFEQVSDTHRSGLWILVTQQYKNAPHVPAVWCAHTHIHTHAHTHIHTHTQGLQETEEFVLYTQAKQCSRLYPCITPRFIPTCSVKMMKGAASSKF
jgi:hypothetical protein